MTTTTTIRVSRETHSLIAQLARQRHETVDQTVSRAIRALRQDEITHELAQDLTEDDKAWLSADAG